jgi:hypothetical protein
LRQQRDRLVEAGARQVAQVAALGLDDALLAWPAKTSKPTGLNWPNTGLLSQSSNWLPNAHSDWPLLTCCLMLHAPKVDDSRHPLDSASQLKLANGS